MQIIDTFSGIGGFSLAGDSLGWRTIQFCEMNEYCQKVLRQKWPEVPIHNDIKTLTAQQIKNNPLYDPNETTILTGGVPCQPWSQAGKRLGKEDDRNLWPETIKLISELKPDWAVLENVRGIVNWSDGLVFEEVQLDLENEGYQVQSFILPACAVDAPHRRDRIWIIAYSNSNGNQRRGFGENRIEKRESESQEDKWERIWGFTWGTSKSQAPANPSNKHIQGRPFIRSIGSEWEKGNKQFTGNIPSTWQNFPTQPPLCSGNDGFRTELLRQRIREDCMGNISEEEIDKILSTAYSKWRKESLKAAGNAIVPQVAIQIFQSIIDFELNNPT